MRPTICIDGRFVGTWRSKKSARGIDLTLEPFSPLEDAWLPALEAEAQDVARFEGLAEARLTGA